MASAWEYFQALYGYSGEMVEVRSCCCELEASQGPEAGSYKRQVQGMDSINTAGV
jgi:hypothetical protein